MKIGRIASADLVNYFWKTLGKLSKSSRANLKNSAAHGY